MITHDDEPAFSRPHSLDGDGDDICDATGLTKREYFASAALAGILANPDYQLTFTEMGRKAALAADCLINALNEPV